MTTRLFGAVLLAMVAIFGSAAAPPSGCALTGFGTSSGGYMVRCLGGCDGKRCQINTFFIAGAAFDMCLCPDGIEPACCHLVGQLAKPSGHAITTFAPAGDCPSCPASGHCIVEGGSSSGTPAQAVCE